MVQTTDIVDALERLTRQASELRLRCEQDAPGAEIASGALAIADELRELGLKIVSCGLDGWAEPHERALDTFLESVRPSFGLPPRERTDVKMVVRADDPSPQ